MRQIGTLPEDQARPFADYLLTQGISTKLIDGPDGCAIWVHNEEKIKEAKEELRAFEQNPNADQYRSAAAEAQSLRRQKDQKEQEYARRTEQLRQRMSAQQSMGLGPVTRSLLIISVAVFLLSWMNVPIAGRPLSTWLYFTLWFRNGEDLGLQLILNGQVWRLITPIFVHGGPIHIFFNMYMLVLLGSPLERRRGWVEYLLLVLFTAIVSNFAQFAFPDVFTIPSERSGNAPFGGMSGVLYGLFGYLWMRGRYDPNAGLQLHPQVVILLLGWLVICALGIIGQVANTAHVAGLVSGIVFCFGSMFWDGVRWW